MKSKGAPAWTRYNVVGWGNPMRLNGWAPDGRRPLTAICAQMPHVA